MRVSRFAMLAAVGVLMVSVSAALAQTGGVKGKVVDAEGEAVAEAQVRVMPVPQRGPEGRPGGRPQAAPGTPEAREMQDRPRREGRPEGRPGPGERPEPVASGETDENGEFELDGIPAGEYMVVAMVQGRGMGRARVTVEADETADAGTITLRARGGGGREGDRPQRRRPGDGEAI